MTGFEALGQQRSRPRGCWHCGEPTQAIVSVSIRERVTGVSGPGRMLASISRSYCEPCSVAAFFELKAKVESDREEQER